MKQELIDRMEAYVRMHANRGSCKAREIAAELDKPDYLVIARVICARAYPEWAEDYLSGDLDTDSGVVYALEHLERAAGLRT